MRLEGFSKKAVLSLGMLATVSTKAINRDRINSIDKNMSNVTNSSENAIWNEINSIQNDTLRSKVLKTESCVWLDAKSKDISDITKSVCKLNHTQSKETCIDKEKFEAFVRSLYEGKSFSKRIIQVEGRIFLRRVTQIAVCLPAVISGMIVGKYILLRAYGGIDRLRQRDIADNFNEGDMRNIGIFFRRRRMYSSSSDITIVVDETQGSIHSDDTLIAEELDSEESETMDS